MRDAGGRALPDARARARGQPAAAAHHPARCAPARCHRVPACCGPVHAGERAGSASSRESCGAAVVLCQGMGSVAAATICGCTALLAMLASLTHTRTSALSTAPRVAIQSALHALKRRSLSCPNRVRCSERRRGAAPGRRLQERPHRYLDRSSDPGQCGGLAAVPELRLPVPQREDSESSSATGDSPTSTIQLIIKRDS